jgi:tetratricopeptide (TPR) repeat protein
VALVQLGKYENALKIGSNIDKAYCLYKMKRFEESLKQCEHLDGEAADRLKAQIYFKLGRYSESAQVYERLSQADPENEEILTNW